MHYATQSHHITLFLVGRLMHKKCDQSGPLPPACMGHVVSDKSLHSSKTLLGPDSIPRYSIHTITCTHSSVHVHSNSPVSQSVVGRKGPATSTTSTANPTPSRHDTSAGQHQQQRPSSCPWLEGGCQGTHAQVCCIIPTEDSQPHRAAALTMNGVLPFPERHP